MNRILKRFLFIAVCLALAIAPVAAYGYQGYLGFNDSLPRLVDEAGLLSVVEEQELDAKLLALAKEYEIDVAVVIVYSTGGKTDEEYADDYFDEHGYGAGEMGDGLLLLLDMGGRYMHISTFREANNYFTSDVIDDSLDEITPYMQSNDLYRAISAFITYTGRVFREGPSRHDTYTEDGSVSHLSGILASTGGLGALVGLITAESMRKGMHTARPTYDPYRYTKNTGLSLEDSRDVYLYSTTTSRRIPRDEDREGGRGGGGGGFHTSSSGREHGGGGRGF